MATNAGIKLLPEIQHHYPTVKRVIDAKEKRPITFAIDSCDCKLGRPQSPHTCSAAIALARQTGLPAMVRRWVTILVDVKKRVAYRYMNDPKLASAIHSFDLSSLSGKAKFQPGIYKISRPSARQSLDRQPPTPTKRHGSHAHKGPQKPLRMTWSDPKPRLGPVVSIAA